MVGFGKEERVAVEEVRGDHSFTHHASRLAVLLLFPHHIIAT
jgi:hypothetical protein